MGGTRISRRIGFLVLLVLAAIFPRLQAQENETYDPYHAEKDVEVGIFYMHKGDVDAAIGRFENAIREKPDFARPRLLLGEAHEKKGEKSEAVKYYKEYLRILPKAPDAKRIKKRIDKLTAEINHEAGTPH